MNIFTGRCTIRTPVTEDVHGLIELEADAVSMRYLDGPTHPPLNKVNEKIQSIDQDSSSFLVIALTKTGEVIGRCALCCDGEGSGEVEIVLRSTYHKDGYGPEVLDRLLAYGFEELFLHKIQAKVNPANEPCMKLLRRKKFVQISTVSDDQAVPHWDWLVFDLSAHE